MTLVKKNSEDSRNKDWGLLQRGWGQLQEENIEDGENEDSWEDEENEESKDEENI